MSATRLGEQAGIPYSRCGRTKAPYKGIKADFERSWKEGLILKINRLALFSAQCTADANKARLLIFMIMRSYQDLSKSAFILSYEAFVRPHLEYGMPACSPNLIADINHQQRIQRLGTRLVTGMRHLPYEERLQRLGLHSLQRRRLRVAR